MLAGRNTGCRPYAIARPAGSAIISHLLSVLMLYTDHRCFPEDVEFIRTHFKHRCRADRYTFPAPITLIRIDGDVPIARAIFKPIVCYHALSFSRFVVRSLQFVVKETTNCKLRTDHFQGECSNIRLANLSGLFQPSPEPSLPPQVFYIQLSSFLYSRPPLLSKGPLRVQPLQGVCNSRETP